MYCKPARAERTQINRALDRWGAFEFFKDKAFLIEKEGKKKVVVCLVTDRLEEVMMIHTTDLYRSGLAIGELKKQFIPSIAGADLFARYGERNKFYIAVSEKAENLLLIVLNKWFEAIAVGRTRFAGRSLFQKGRVTVTNISDAGYYLREEG